MLTLLGKRLLKQWVCHPLSDATRINKRLDAVESIMNDDTFRELFVQHLAKLPDLERMISRVHAGSAKVGDFLRVLEGFERIQVAIREFRQRGNNDGLIAQILAEVPDLQEALQPWETAFDREKVRADGMFQACHLVLLFSLLNSAIGVLVPELGVEDDFDQSQSVIDGIVSELQTCLHSYSKTLKFAFSALT